MDCLQKSGMMVIATQVELFGIAFAKKIPLLGTWANNFSVGFEALPISQSRMMNGLLEINKCLRNLRTWTSFGSHSRKIRKSPVTSSKKCWCHTSLIVSSRSFIWNFPNLFPQHEIYCIEEKATKNWCCLWKYNWKPTNFVFVLHLCFLRAHTKCSQDELHNYLTSKCINDSFRTHPPV